LFDRVGRIGYGGIEQFRVVRIAWFHAFVYFKIALGVF